jgi:hypothetical protein
MKISAYLFSNLENKCKKKPKNLIKTALLTLSSGIIKAL